MFMQVWKNVTIAMLQAAMAVTQAVSLSSVVMALCKLQQEKNATMPIPLMAIAVPTPVHSPVVAMALLAMASSSVMTATTSTPMTVETTAKMPAVVMAWSGRVKNATAVTIAILTAPFRRYVAMALSKVTSSVTMAMMTPSMVA